MQKILTQKERKFIKTRQKALAKKTFKHCFERWQGYIGLENSEGKYLTKKMLIEWCKNPDKRVECTFCGRDYAYDESALVCTNCHEYKGIQPLIIGWSEWQ